MRRDERGAGGLFVVIVIALAMVAVLAFTVFSRLNLTANEKTRTLANLNAAAAGLEQFASATGRLPCPANPATDDGTELPAVPTGNCDFRQGVVPWRTIGLRHDDSLDGWGRKISYRVYSDVLGSLTQPGGASMVSCDTSLLAPNTDLGVDGNGLCRADHATLPATFILNKGLQVTDFGVQYRPAASNGAAYVLISHGATGLGAYTSAGIQMTLPTVADELANLAASGPFVARAQNSADPADTFDDVLFFRTVADLATRARLVARDWPDALPPLASASVEFDRNTVRAALGGTDPRNNGGNTGRTSITFTGVTVSAFNSSGAQNVAYTEGTGGSADAIGGTSGGSNNLSSTGGEGLQFNFTGSARQFSASLSSFTGFERAEVKFYQVNQSTSVASLVGTVDKSACGTSTISSFVINPGVAFNRVEIRPLTQTFLGLASSFRVAEIKSCDTGVTCHTSLFNSGDQC